MTLAFNQWQLFEGKRMNEQTSRTLKAGDRVVYTQTKAGDLVLKEPRKFYGTVSRNTDRALYVTYDDGGDGVMGHEDSERLERA